MLVLEELDPRISLRVQMQTSVGGPAVLINLFSVAPQEADMLLRAWTEDAKFMQAQPGFMHTQLHKGIGGNSLFLNYALWESVDAFREAFNQPLFQASLENYPGSAIARPHLFEKVNVPGMGGAGEGGKDSKRG